VNDIGVKTAQADHPKWAEINGLYNQISYIPNKSGFGGTFHGPIDEMVNTMDMKTAVETYTVGLLSVNALGVTYNGRTIHTIDAERVMAFMRDKLSYKPIANYIARKMQNPSARAIQEMYNFLEHKGMPLTLRGTFIAYKGVSLDLWSICGNKDTVERSSVDDDFRQGCSAGLHVGSLAYARDWGKRVILVEVDPIDVVSVPSDCNCQKLRCCKYTVVGEYSGPMPDTLTTEFDSTEDDVCHQCGNPIDDCSCDDTEDNDTEYESTPNALWLAPSAINIPPPLAVKLDAPVNAPLNPDVYTRVVNIIAEQFGIEVAKLTPDTRVNYDTLGMDSLDDTLGMDSLDVVELCMAFEEEFDIEIPDELFETYIDSTIGEISQSIESFSNGKRDAQIDVQHQRQPVWRDGDWNGGDSKSHVAYIYGYVATANGYNDFSQ
jgi:acyl carrier protein